MAVDPGLCKTCRHARLTVNDRSSRFYRCGRASSDSRFVKYPRLPVKQCPGYEAQHPVTDDHGWR